MSKRILLLVIILMWAGTFAIHAEKVSPDYHLEEYGAFSIEGLDGTVEGDFISFYYGYIYVPYEEFYLEEEPWGFWDDTDEDSAESGEVSDDDATSDEDSSESYDDAIILEVEGLRYDLTLNQFDFSEAWVSGCFAINSLVWAEISSASLDGEGLHLWGEASVSCYLIEGLDEELSFLEFTLTPDGELTIAAAIPEGTSFTFCECFQISTDTMYIRNEEGLNSIYFLSGTLELSDAMAEVLSVPEPIDINIIEITDNEEVMKFDTTFHQIPVYLSGMEANLYVRELTSLAVSFGGWVWLPEALPGGLSRLPMEVYNLEMDVCSGLIYDFSAYQESPEPINMNGLTVEMNGVLFEGGVMKFLSSIQLPEGMFSELARGYGGRFIECNTFEMNYDGTFKELDLYMSLWNNFILENDTKVLVGGIGIHLENAPLTNSLFLFEGAELFLNDGTRVNADGLGINPAGELVWPEHLKQYESKFKMVEEKMVG